MVEALKDVVWSESQFNPKSLAERFPREFPIIIKVSKGFHGENELDTVSAGQVARIHSMSSQRRVLLEDTRGRMLSVPIDFPFKFELYDRRNKKKKRKWLKDIVNRHRLPTLAGFDRKTSGKFKVGQRMFVPENFGRVLILTEYHERFLRANTIHDGVIDKKVTLLPLYLDVRMAVASGLKGASRSDWLALKDMYKRAVAHIEFEKVSGSPDLLLFTEEDLERRLGAGSLDVLKSVSQIFREAASERVQRSRSNSLSSTLRRRQKHNKRATNNNKSLPYMPFAFNTQDGPAVIGNGGVRPYAGLGRYPESSSDSTVTGDVPAGGRVTLNQAGVRVGNRGRYATTRSEGFSDSSRATSPRTRRSRRNQTPGDPRAYPADGGFSDPEGYGPSTVQSRLYSSTGDLRGAFSLPRDTHVSSSSSDVFTRRPAGPHHGPARRSVAMRRSRSVGRLSGVHKYGTTFVSGETLDRDYGTYGDWKKVPVFRGTLSQTSDGPRTWDRKLNWAMDGSTTGSSSSGFRYQANPDYANGYHSPPFIQRLQVENGPTSGDRNRSWVLNVDTGSGIPAANDATTYSRSAPQPPGAGLLQVPSLAPPRGGIRIQGATTGATSDDIVMFVGQTRGINIGTNSRAAATAASGSVLHADLPHVDSRDKDTLHIGIDGRDLEAYRGRRTSPERRRQQPRQQQPRQQQPRQQQPRQQQPRQQQPHQPHQPRQQRMTSPARHGVRITSPNMADDRDPGASRNNILLRHDDEDSVYEGTMTIPYPGKPDLVDGPYAGRPAGVGQGERGRRMEHVTRMQNNGPSGVAYSEESESESDSDSDDGVEGERIQEEQIVAVQNSPERGRLVSGSIPDIPEEELAAIQQAKDKGRLLSIPNPDVFIPRGGYSGRGREQKQGAWRRPAGGLYQYDARAAGGANDRVDGGGQGYYGNDRVDDGGRGSHGNDRVDVNGGRQRASRQTSSDSGNWRLRTIPVTLEGSLANSDASSTSTLTPVEDFEEVNDVTVYDDVSGLPPRDVIGGKNVRVIDVSVEVDSLPRTPAKDSREVVEEVREVKEEVREVKEEVQEVAQGPRGAAQPSAAAAEPLQEEYEPEVEVTGGIASIMASTRSDAMRELARMFASKAEDDVTEGETAVGDDVTTQGESTLYQTTAMTSRRPPSPVASQLSTSSSIPPPPVPPKLYAVDIEADTAIMETTGDTIVRETTGNTTTTTNLSRQGSSLEAQSPTTTAAREEIRRGRGLHEVSTAPSKSFQYRAGEPDRELSSPPPIDYRKRLDQRFFQDTRQSHSSRGGDHSATRQSHSSGGGAIQSSTHSELQSIPKAMKVPPPTAEAGAPSGEPSSSIRTAVRSQTSRQNSEGIQDELRAVLRARSISTDEDAGPKSASPERSRPVSSVLSGSPARSRPVSSVKSVSPDRSRPVSSVLSRSPDRSRPVSSVKSGSPDRSRPVSSVLSVSQNESGQLSSVHSEESRSLVTSRLDPEDNDDAMSDKSSTYEGSYDFVNAVHDHGRSPDVQPGNLQRAGSVNSLRELLRRAGSESYTLAVHDDGGALSRDAPDLVSRGAVGASGVQSTGKSSFETSTSEAASGIRANGVTDADTTSYSSAEGAGWATFDSAATAQDAASKTSNTGTSAQGASSRTSYTTTTTTKTVKSGERVPERVSSSHSRESRVTRQTKVSGQTRPQQTPQGDAGRAQAPRGDARRGSGAFLFRSGSNVSEDNKMGVISYDPASAAHNPNFILKRKEGTFLDETGNNKNKRIGKQHDHKRSSGIVSPDFWRAGDDQGSSAGRGTGSPPQTAGASPPRAAQQPHRGSRQSGGGGSEASRSVVASSTEEGPRSKKGGPQRQSASRAHDDAQLVDRESREYPMESIDDSIRDLDNFLKSQDVTDDGMSHSSRASSKVERFNFGLPNLPADNTMF